jgi:hypothetical protein
MPIRRKEPLMLKWRFLAIAGVMFGIGGIGWGYAQQRSFPGFYELRIYKAQPGRRDALAARFASRTSAIYARYGITNVGYFIPQQSDPELGIDAADTFIYIRAYPSKDERDRRLKAARSDPEFEQVVLAQERDPNARLIVKAHNIDMTPSGTYTAITVVP